MNRGGRLLSSVSLLLISVLLILGLLNLQAVADWWRLRGYDPPATIASIAEADTMTDHGKNLFFTTRPELINKADNFRQACPSFEQTIVLGCYHSGFNSAIYIYDVQDERLSGVVEVTAAHETLHAAYDRMGQDEKNRINAQLNNFYANNLQDERVLETIESYEKSASGVLVNEMHSIFGTEIEELPKELETHYQRYFTNRQKVVAFADRYADEFTDRQTQIKDYQQRLNELKNQIDSREKTLSQQQAQIEAERRRMDNLRASGRLEEYNAAVPGFNAMVNGYNSGVNRLRSDIAEYNRLVAAHNELAAELSSLYQSLDTSLTPQARQ